MYNNPGKYIIPYFLPTTNTPLYARVSTTVSSWSFPSVSYGQVALSDDVPLILVNSFITDIRPIPAYVRLPTRVEGMEICIRDANGFVSLSQLRVFPSNGDTTSQVYIPQ